MAPTRDGLPVIFAAAVPLLAMQVGVGFLRLQVRRKRGVRRFRRELVRGGMPKERASQLAQAYHDTGSVRKILRSVRSPGE